MLKTVSSIANAIGALNYKGTWDANANSPALASSVGTKGDYYVVGTAGTTALNGISNWGIGDWAVFNGSVWQRVEGGADLNGVNLSVSGTSQLTGNATFSDNLVQGTAAKGVNFTANTPAAGMTSQLLNWYEVGTFTPDLLIAGGNTGVTYTSRSGRYTRIGRLVEVECSVVLSSKGARTGVVRIGGLPFTPGIDVLPATIVPTGTWASLVAGGSIQAYISGTAVYLLLGTTTGTTGLTDVNLSNTSAFTFTATFSV